MFGSNGLGPWSTGKGTPLPRGLLLGWAAADSQSSFGFSARSASPTESGAVLYDGEAHLLTCAPTGMGKGRGVLIPNALLYPGPLIAVDIKGELYQVTARRRREMGQHVVALDPFRVASGESGALNPLDILDLPASDLEGDAEMLASLLSVGHEFSRDPYWNDTATGLISGLIAHVASSCRTGERHLGQVRNWLYHDDLDFEIAKALDEGQVKSRVAREQFIAYLAAPTDKTRPCIRSTACTYVNVLGSDGVAAALRRSTFRLQDLVEGKPLTVYLIIPPDKLDSHNALLRLWVGTLLTVVGRRRHIPAQRTVFLIDESAQLGSLSALRQAVTLHRGSGLQVWTVWQDLGQLQRLYPLDWQTMVTNSSVLQVFGINNHLMAMQWAELLGKAPDELLRLPPEQAVVYRHGQGYCVCRRPDYLQDQMFAGLYDPNERYALYGKAAKARSRKKGRGGCER